MVSLENKKLLRIRLDSARRHARLACGHAKSEWAAREIHAAVADLSSALGLIFDALNRRPEFYSGSVKWTSHDEPMLPGRLRQGPECK